MQNQLALEEAKKEITELKEKTASLSDELEGEKLKVSALEKVIRSMSVAPANGGTKDEEGSVEKHSDDDDDDDASSPDKQTTKEEVEKKSSERERKSSSSKDSERRRRPSMSSSSRHTS